MYGPRTRAVIGSRTDYVRGPCTAVYTVCGRQCAHAVNTAVYRVHDRVGVPCIRPWTHHVHGPCTPVYTVHTRRELSCTRPYTRYVQRTGRKHGRIHGHGRTMYMVVHGRVQSVHDRGRPCTDCARPPSAVYKLCTRPYTGHAHGPPVSRTRPCTQPVHGKTRPGTRPVPGRVRGPYPTVYVPYTRPFRGRVPCTCTCLRPVYTAVHGRVQTVYGPCTWSVHDPNATAAPTRPCLQPVLSNKFLLSTFAMPGMHPCRGVHGPYTP